MPVKTPKTKSKTVRASGRPRAGAKSRSASDGKSPRAAARSPKAAKPLRDRPARSRARGVAVLPTRRKSERPAPAAAASSPPRTAKTAVVEVPPIIQAPPGPLAQAVAAIETARAGAAPAAPPAGAAATPAFPRDDYDYAYLKHFLAREIAPRDCRAVVFGCGRGESAVYLSLGNYRVTGLDADRNAVGLARERAWLNHCDVDFMIGDVFETSALLPAESFGLAIDHGALQGAAREGREAPGVFQTIKGERDRRRYLEAVHRILLPGGIFVLAATQVDIQKKTSRRRDDRAGALLVQEGGEVVGEVIRAGLQIVDRILYPFDDGSRAELVLYTRK